MGQQKTQPFSLRLSTRVNRYVTEEAKRTRRSKGAVLDALADEAIRVRRFPGVGFKGDDWDRRAWLMGTGLDIWQIIEALKDFGSVDRMTAESDLNDRQIRLALAYYGEYPEEIDQAISENRRSLEELRAEYPHIDVIEVDC
jgi:uncharacterized protein (DUF433 family)